VSIVVYRLRARPQVRDVLRMLLKAWTLMLIVTRKVTESLTIGADITPAAIVSRDKTSCEQAELSDLPYSASPARATRNPEPIG
jgi:hypothetical protein